MEVMNQAFQIDIASERAGATMYWKFRIFGFGLITIRACWFWGFKPVAWR